MKIVLISGLSGAGKTVALNLLEDIGYYCVDNLPLSLLPDLVHLHTNRNIDKLGISMDIRSDWDISALHTHLDYLRQDGHQIDIVFLEASENVLLRRFSETRRSHPLSRHNTVSLSEGLKRERDWLSPLREIAYCIDTSKLNAYQLRHLLQQWLDVKRQGLLLSIESFGFKYGAPIHADFVFDVRSLPNPYYEPSLRAFTGLDKPIQDFFLKQTDVMEMVDDIAGFLERRLNKIQADSRSYVVIGIGCTGGQHRSVFISEQIGKRLEQYFPTLVRHRQLLAPFS